MASTTSRRLVLRGRPPGWTGISPSISRHCSSVTSLGYLFVLIPTTYENHPLWDSHSACSRTPVMDATDAKRLVRESLSISNKDCGAWSPPDRDRDEFLNERRSDLVKSLVEPYRVLVTPDRIARTFGEWEDRPYAMFVVAKGGKNSVLLINSETGRFSLGSVDAAGIVY